MLKKIISRLGRFLYGRFVGRPWQEYDWMRKFRCVIICPNQSNLCIKSLLFARLCGKLWDIINKKKDSPSPQEAYNIIGEDNTPKGTGKLGAGQRTAYWQVSWSMDWKPRRETNAKGHEVSPGFALYKQRH